MEAKDFCEAEPLGGGDLMKHRRTKIGCHPCLQRLLENPGSRHNGTQCFFVFCTMYFKIICSPVLEKINTEILKYLTFSFTNLKV